MSPHQPNVRVGKLAEVLHELQAIHETLARSRTR